MLHKKSLLSAVILLMLLLIVACRESPTATPAPATGTPTATPLPATGTPTTTPVPATATPPATAVPTATEEAVQTEIVAEIGFRPRLDGFKFPNFDNNEYAFGALTIEQIRSVFGDQVCANIQGDFCAPSPAAELWLKMVNQARAGGHCEGMCVLSVELFKNPELLQDYGGGSTASDLIPSEKLMQDITFYWMLQALEPVVSETNRFQDMTASEILDTLIEAMQTGGDFYTVGIYGPDGGHTLTPYAVENRGDGMFRVYVYDSNYPGAEKFIEINVNDNSWRYAVGTAEPVTDRDDDYWGGGPDEPGSIDLTSLAARQQPVCPFCGETGGDSLDRELVVLLNGKGIRPGARSADKRLIETATGRRIRRVRLKGGLYDDDQGWLMVLPSGSDYNISLDGEAQDGEPMEVAVFQPGINYAVRELSLDPGQQDQLIISEEGAFGYVAGNAQAPRLEVATDDPGGVAASATISEFDLGQGRSITVSLDAAKRRLSLSEDDPNLDTFNLELNSVEDGDMNVLFNDVVQTGDDGQVGFDIVPYQLVYPKWDGEQHNDLYVADTYGNDERFILSRAAGPSWSADGRSIFFYGEEGVDRQIVGDVTFLKDGISNGIVALQADPLPDSVALAKLFQPPNWKQGTARWANVSPDGNTIAYGADFSGEFRVYFLDRLSLEQLPTQIIGEQADWSPDGQQIVYRSGQQNETGLWISDRDGSNARVITNNNDSFPAWSPDGTTIAFSREVNGNVDIYTINVAGSALRRLTEDPAHDTLPVYTPAGDIIFRSARENNWGIWRMSGDGTNQVKIISDAPVQDDDWAFSRMDVK